MEWIGGAIAGLFMGIFILLILYSGFNRGLKEKYVKCGIAQYNTTSGAFEVKPQYKILGEWNNEYNSRRIRIFKKYICSKNR